MTKSAQGKSDVPLEAPSLDRAVPLELILRTEELYRRPWRPPDYAKENRALVALVSALADSPHTILQTLADEVLKVLRADSAGLSLLTKDEKRFYWAAIAGAWQSHIGGGTARESGPCGDVLDRNTPMLFTHWERRYPYLCPATPLAEEGLLVPFYVNGKAVGTIWGIAHTNHRNFDAEDLRLLESLGRFASTAYQAVASIDDLRFQVTAREKAEVALQELAKGLQAKVRRLVEANIIGIVIWNLEGPIIEANEAFLRMLGYDREDLISGRVSWRELTPHKWRAPDERALAELAAIGVCEPFEKEYIRKDGSCVPVLVGAALLEGSGSEGVAFVLDLTAQKSSEDALRRSEYYLIEAQRLSHTGSWAWNVSTGEVLWSREIYCIFGLDPEQTSLNVDLIVKLRHPEDRALAEQTLRAALREARDFEFDSRILRPDGSIRHVRSVGRPVINDAGVLIEFVGAVMDVTEAKTREEALRKSQAELAHLTRVATLGEMSASIAHEINQPLTAAVTSASACLRWLDAQKLEEARRSASRVLAEGHRASEIMGRIRTLTKKAPPQKSWLDVNETIHEVIALARSEIQRNGVALETELSEHVPLILADRIELQQVILNLVMNAVEAMSGLRDGRRELLIRSRTDELEQAVISVQDSGPGIEPENLDHLFKAFYTTKPQGMGMGLAISRSIVEAHGGRLWATLNVPRGAVFQFALPVGSENVA